MCDFSYMTVGGVQLTARHPKGDSTRNGSYNKAGARYFRGPLLHNRRRCVPRWKEGKRRHHCLPVGEAIKYNTIELRMRKLVLSFPRVGFFPCMTSIGSLTAFHCFSKAAVKAYKPKSYERCESFI